MPLTIYQKSLYLIILNATMILRSIGRTFRKRPEVNDESIEEEIKKFKQKVFEEIETLTNLMNNGNLLEENILKSIKRLSEEFGISFGQAQKPINVILKYHFLLTREENDPQKKELHCPIDSKNLRNIHRSGLSLKRINEDEDKYLEIQSEILEIQQNREGFNATRVDFDISWDRRNLEDEGLL